MLWNSSRRILFFSSCSKAKHILGLLYRRFYGLADCKAIIQIYLSIVRSHLEYTSSLWDPHAVRDISALEDVQKFACKVASKQWDSDYQQLLNVCVIPSLAEHREQLKLCQLYKIVHGLCYFPCDIFVLDSNPYSSVTRSHSMVLKQPYANTNAFLYSFVPSSISKWNKLSDEQVCAPSIHTFKQSLFN